MHCCHSSRHISNILDGVEGMEDMPFAKARRVKWVGPKFLGAKAVVTTLLLALSAAAKSSSFVKLLSYSRLQSWEQKTRTVRCARFNLSIAVS
eukprot:2727845-Pleurochrysis_carterae.AAC.3